MTHVYFIHVSCLLNGLHLLTQFRLRAQYPSLISFICYFRTRNVKSRNAGFRVEVSDVSILEKPATFAKNKQYLAENSMKLLQGEMQ